MCIIKMWSRCRVLWTMWQNQSCVNNKQLSKNEINRFKFWTILNGSWFNMDNINELDLYFGKIFIFPVSIKNNIYCARDHAYIK